MGLFSASKEKKRKREEEAQAREKQLVYNMLYSGASADDPVQFEAAIHMGADIHDPVVWNEALTNGRYKILDYLFSHGVNVDKDLGGGVTPLISMASVAGDKSEMILYLLSRGANIHAKTLDGVTAFAAAMSDSALYYSDKNALALLSKTPSFADTGIKPVAVLTSAIERLRWDLAKVLIEQGVPLEQGKTLLNFARNRNWDGAKQLVELGQNVNVIDPGNDGWSPLHYAAKNGSGDFVKFLLTEGADPDVRDSIMRTAADVAEDNYPQIAGFIRLYQKKTAPVLSGDAVASFDEKWCISMPGEVAHVIEKNALGYRITETFNFHTRVYTQIARNLETNAESQVMRMFDEFNDRAVLERALDKINSLGERVDASILFPMQKAPALPKANGA